MPGQQMFNEIRFAGKVLVIESSGLMIPTLMARLAKGIHSARRRVQLRVFDSFGFPAVGTFVEGVVSLVESGVAVEADIMSKCTVWFGGVGTY